MRRHACRFQRRVKAGRRTEFCVRIARTKYHQSRGEMSLDPIAGFSATQLTHCLMSPTAFGPSPLAKTPDGHRGQRRQRRTVYSPAVGAGERAASRRKLNEGNATDVLMRRIMGRSRPGKQSLGTNSQKPPIPKGPLSGGGAVVVLSRAIANTQLDERAVCRRPWAAARS